MKRNGGAWKAVIRRGWGVVAVGLVLAGCTARAATPSPKAYQGTSLGGEVAPGFQLTDQRGQSVGLADFRGKVVALTFFDSRCADVCPLTAVELRHAANVLGAGAQDRVAFVAVNINARHNTPADVAEFSRQNELDRLPNWYFLTGAPPQLEAVAKDYFVFAADRGDGRFDHTPGIFVIDRDGRRQVYLDVPPEQAIETRPGDLLARQMQRYLD